MSDVEKRIEQWREGLAGSELLRQSDVSELESHLREEMEHLKTTGLSDDEALFVARRRLGDTATLEEEFAKVRPHRQLIHRLFWMAAGILGYRLALYVSICVSNVATVLGYTAGLQSPLLNILGSVVRVAVFAGIGALLWHYLDSSASRAAPARTPISLRVGLLAACAIVGLSFTTLYGPSLFFRIMPMQEFTRIVMAERWLSIIWFTVMPFLLVGLVGILALRDRRSAQNA